MFQLQTFRLFTLITVISHSTAVSITYAKNNHIKTMLCPIHYSNPYTRNDIPTYLKTTLSQAPQKQKKSWKQLSRSKTTLKQNFREHTRTENRTQGEAEWQWHLQGGS